MKIVFYTQRVELIEKFRERRDCADQRIPQFIRACGYLPIALPNNIELVKEIMEKIHPDGIILTGGNSLAKYDGDAPERDMVDDYLIENAMTQNIPLYGFCRGMQSILNYFGNELVNVSDHVAVNHLVTGTYGSRTVNSYHHQGCLELKDSSLEVSMKSEDGVIEMVKHTSYPIVGTMWHPERNAPFQEKDIQMVQNLIERKML